MTPFTRADTSILGQWWWTVDRWSLAAIAAAEIVSPVARGSASSATRSILSLAIGILPLARVTLSIEASEAPGPGASGDGRCMPQTDDPPRIAATSSRVSGSPCMLTSTSTSTVSRLVKPGASPTMLRGSDAISPARSSRASKVSSGRSTSSA